MNETRTNIVRSYSRKVNKGNYESEDFFASYGQEFPGGMTAEEIEAKSIELFNRAKNDVEKAINPLPPEDLVVVVNDELQTLREQVVYNVLNGLPTFVSDYEKATNGSPVTATAINEAKKEYKRTHPQELRNPDMPRGKLAAVASAKEQLNK